MKDKSFIGALGQRRLPALRDLHRIMLHAPHGAFPMFMILQGGSVALGGIAWLSLACYYEWFEDKNINDKSGLFDVPGFLVGAVPVAVAGTIMHLV